MTNSVTSPEPPSATPPEPAAALSSRARRLAAGGLAVVVVLVLVVALGSGSAAGPPDTGAAAIVPADALAYVNVSLDRGRPAVGRALALARRFPDYPLAYGAVIARLGAIVSGGRAVDGGRIRPWLGDEAALALLDTTTSTAGSLIALRVTDPGRARTFLRSVGASPRGTYRHTALLAYPSGTELAFVGDYLVLGEDASVRMAIDVAAGATASLAADPVYRRASAPEPAGRVLDAYASVAGVRRLLAPQGGVVGALGALLYQPALQGVALALSPAAGGARVTVHSALDPSLVRLSPPVTSSFTPTLPNAMPSGAILMLDVTGLDRVAPAVLNAGAAAGVAGGIGPLLSRLGAALSTEGVNVHDVVSIFRSETAVAIVSNGQSPALVIVARTADEAKARSELAGLQIPLAQLFGPPSTGAGRVPTFNDREVSGVTDHQLSLSNGLELDYAVFGGKVVISTSLNGIAAVARRAHTLARDPAFQFVAGGHPTRLTSLVYLDFPRLLAFGAQIGLTAGKRFVALRGDLERIRAIGLSSTRGTGESSATVSIRIP